MKHDESLIQAQIVQFLQERCIFFFAVSNEMMGGATNAARRMATFIAMGLKKGISDLVLVGGNGQIYFLEIKTKTGKLSESQMRFRALCYANGWAYGVARSVDDAAHLVDIWGVAPYTR